MVTNCDRDISMRPVSMAGRGIVAAPSIRLPSNSTSRSISALVRFSVTAISRQSANSG